LAPSDSPISSPIATGPCSTMANSASDHCSAAMHCCRACRGEHGYQPDHGYGRGQRVFPTW
jgi:hypothetical protein